MFLDLFYMKCKNALILGMEIAFKCVFLAPADTEKGIYAIK